MKNKIQNFFKILLRFLSAAVAPFFKDPIIALIAFVGLILLYSPIKTYLITILGIDNATNLKELVTKFDLYKIVTEIVIGLIGYFLYLKEVFRAYKSRSEFKNILTFELQRIHTKMESIKVSHVISSNFIDSVASILLPIWIKDESFDKIEINFIKLISKFITQNYSDGKKLFALYFLLDLYPFSRSFFLSYIIHLPIQESNYKHEFLSLLYNAQTSLRTNKFNLNDETKFINIELAKKVQQELANGNIVFYESSLREKFSHEALLNVAEQLIKKGYTDVSTLLKYRNRKNPIKMLVKYGENFHYWETEQIKKIKEIFQGNSQADKLKQLNSLAHPQPFSKAIFEFKNELVQLLPKDPFLFLFDIDYIEKKHKIKTPNKFIQRKVLPNAKQYHTKMIKEIRKFDKSFSNIDKEFISNYYIIDMDIESVLIEADPKSTPEGLRRILVREVAQSGNFASLLANNNVYIKEIIENLPAYSILTIMGTESKMIDFFKVYDKKIRTQLKTVELSIKNIYESKKIGIKFKKTAAEIIKITKDADYKGPIITLKEIELSLKNMAEGSAKLEHLVEKGFTIEK